MGDQIALYDEASKKLGKPKEFRDIKTLPQKPRIDKNGNEIGATTPIALHADLLEIDKTALVQDPDGTGDTATYEFQHVTSDGNVTKTRFKIEGGTNPTVETIPHGVAVVKSDFDGTQKIELGTSNITVYKDYHIYYFAEASKTFTVADHPGLAKKGVKLDITGRLDFGYYVNSPTFKDVVHKINIQWGMQLVVTNHLEGGEVVTTDHFGMNTSGHNGFGGDTLLKTITTDGKDVEVIMKPYVIVEKIKDKVGESVHIDLARATISMSPCS